MNLKPYIRYLWKALLYGVGYFLLGELLFPDRHTRTSTIWFGLTLGLLTQSLSFLRDLLGLQEDEPFPPVIYLWLGLGALIIATAWWYRTASIQLGGFRVFGILFFVAYGVYYLARGTLLLRRGRSANGGEDS